MDQYTMASGMKIKNVEEVRCYTQMALTMMVNGKVIKCTVSVFTYPVPEIDTKVTSVMVLEMAQD
jgi:hypothetical protein